MPEVIVLDSDEESNPKTDVTVNKPQSAPQSSNNDNNIKINETKEIKESPNKKRKSYDKYDSFSVRNSYFFRIGKNAILPAIILIDEPAEFDQIRFQELLGLIKEILPIHFCYIEGFEQNGFDSARNFESATPQVYKGDNFCFTYQFRPTNGKYSVLIPVCLLFISVTFQSEARRISNSNTTTKETNTLEKSDTDNQNNNNNNQENNNDNQEKTKDDTLQTEEVTTEDKQKEPQKELPQKEPLVENSKPEVPYYQSPSESEEEEEEEGEQEEAEQEEESQAASEPQDTESQHEDAEQVVEENNSNNQGPANLMYKLEQAENQIIQHHSEQYRGGAYRGFHIFKYTMIIEVALKKEIVQMADQWGAKAANKISHYFAPATTKSGTKKPKHTPQAPKGAKKTSKPKGKLSTKTPKGKGKNG